MCERLWRIRTCLASSRGFVHLRLELWCKLQWKDCDREVANAAGRALAGVVVAAHGAANLEDSFGEHGFFGRKTARTCVYERELWKGFCQEGRISHSWKSREAATHASKSKRSPVLLR